MAQYFYKAVSLSGEQQSGQQEAQDERELARLLHQKGFVLTHATTKAGRSVWARAGAFKISFGVSGVEKLMFARNLRVMVAAGVALPKALEILAHQSSNATFSRALLDIKERVVKGQALSVALESYPSLFSELFVSMMRVGEESGTLEQTLSQLALQLEKQHELVSKVVGALLYPAVVVLAMIGIGIMMLVVVVPQLAKTFQDLNVELPVTTQLVIGLGTFLQHRWYLALAIFVALAFTGWRFSRTQSGKALIDTVLLNIPIVSTLLKKTNSALTLRTLSSLIGAGIPIVRSLEITSNALGNVHYKKVLQQAAEAVAKGSKLSETIKQHERLYPLLVGHMMEVGEETGTTSGVLQQLAGFFEDEVAQVTRNLTSLVEPVLMLLIGGVVGFFAVSMLQPMYSLLNALQSQ